MMSHNENNDDTNDDEVKHAEAAGDSNIIVSFTATTTAELINADANADANFYAAGAAVTAVPGGGGGNNNNSTSSRNNKTNSKSKSRNNNSNNNSSNNSNNSSSSSSSSSPPPSIPQRISFPGHRKDSEDVVVWQPDASQSRCRKCLSEFTLVSRRHHCRRCGYLFCGSCSAGETYCDRLASQPTDWIDSLFKPMSGEAVRRACLSCAALYPVTAEQLHQAEANKQAKRGSTSSI
jgi:hypothetical protein